MEMTKSKITWKYFYMRNLSFKLNSLGTFKEIFCFKIFKINLCFLSFNFLNISFLLPVYCCQKNIQKSQIFKVINIKKYLLILLEHSISSIKYVLIYNLGTPGQK